MVDAARYSSCFPLQDACHAGADGKFLPRLIGLFDGAAAALVTMAGALLGGKLALDARRGSVDIRRGRSAFTFDGCAQYLSSPAAPFLLAEVRLLHRRLLRPLRVRDVMARQLLLALQSACLAREWLWHMRV